MPGWMWWAVAIVLVGTEMLSGTFYLLALAVAFAAGGAVHWLGAGFTAQVAAAGIVGVAGCALAYNWHRRKGSRMAPAVTLDVGQRVQVLTWHEDGSARVAYRGTQWDAVLATPETPHQETMFIAEVRGSTLVLADHPSH